LRERDQQHVVDARVVRARQPAQQRRGGGFVQLERHGRRIADRVVGARGRIVDRHRLDGLREQRLPRRGFVSNGLRAGQLPQMQRPFAERGRLLGQRPAVVRGMQILDEHAPRHAVHREVMDRHEQAGERLAGRAEQPRREQRAVHDVDAALRVGGRRAHRRQALGGVACDGLHREDGGHRAAAEHFLSPAVRAARARAQRVVTFADLPERVREPRGGEVGRHLDQDRLVVVRRRVEVLFEEPVLYRRQRRIAERAGYRRGRGVRVGRGGQLRDRLVLEQLLRRHAQPGSVRARDDLDAENRIAAELEEIVVNTDGRQLQHLLPDRREQHFPRRDGRRVWPRRTVGRRRSRQRLAVDLAVRQQRQRRQRDELRRHHVVRELAAQMVAQAGDVTGSGRDVCDQEGSRVFGLRDHDAVVDRRMGAQHGLDFAGLDAQAAQLDLMIDAAEELDVAVGAVAREVAGAVERACGSSENGSAMNFSALRSGSL
jgi:hypothetical protein